MPIKAILGLITINLGSFGIVFSIISRLTHAKYKLSWLIACFVISLAVVLIGAIMAFATEVSKC